MLPRNKTENLLPYDGCVAFDPSFIDVTMQAYFMDVFSNTIPWQSDRIVIFGKTIYTQRKTALFGDSGLTYTYSGTKRQCEIWNQDLLNLKAKLEDQLHETFNSCLLNYYPDGTTAMGWHSDDESDLVANGTIATLSFGATRRFNLKHNKTKNKVSFELHAGSLLVMKDQTQQFWKHNISKTKKVTTPRISLTFRQLIKPCGT